MKNPKCVPALLAALEILQEECGGEKGIFKPVGDGVIIHVPEEFIREFEAKTGHKFGNPLEPGTEKWDKAIEVCVRESIWADRLARKFLGEDAPKEAIERLKRKLCEELLT